jgi:hypothetical protein
MNAVEWLLFLAARRLWADKPPMPSVAAFSRARYQAALPVMVEGWERATGERPRGFTIGGRPVFMSADQIFARCNPGSSCG